MLLPALIAALATSAASDSRRRVEELGGALGLPPPLPPGFRDRVFELYLSGDDDQAAQADEMIRSFGIQNFHFTDQQRRDAVQRAFDMVFGVGGPSDPRGARGVLRLFGLPSRSLDGASALPGSVDIQRLHLEGWSGSDLPLSEARIRTMMLKECVFPGINISRGVFRGSDIIGCDMSGGNMSYALAFGSIIEDSKFDGSNMEGIRLEGAECVRSSFRGSNISSADLSGMLIEECDLSDCDLRGSNLWNSYFDRVNLKGADLRDTNIRDYQLLGCLVDENTKVPPGISAAGETI